MLLQAFSTIPYVSLKSMGSLVGESIVFMEYYKEAQSVKTIEWILMGFSKTSQL